MRPIVFAVFLLASAAFAQLTPAVVVQKGEPFPVIADFNGDGLDDLIQEKNVILNDGTSLADLNELGIPAAERVIGALDVNGDGIPDLLTRESPIYIPGSSASNSIRYRYVADASRHYTRTSDIIQEGMQPYVADADGDGKDDLVLFKTIFGAGNRPKATEVTILRSRGDGTFESLEPFRMPASPQFDAVDRIETGDLDHDGIPDMVIRCPNDLVILHGLGGGRFAVETRYMPMALPGWGWWVTRLTDVDGDGNLDVVTIGFRTIRVFFGDGHGNFPRMATAHIDQLHSLVGRPPAAVMNPDNLNQPRDLAIGHFTRPDRNEIAAGTSEGDIVVFAWQNGALTEVSRTQTEFWALAIRPGHFHQSGLTDIYAIGTLVWGDPMPRPRIFSGTSGAAETTVIPRIAGRHRALAPPPATQTTTLRVQTHADCLADTSAVLAFPRDGAFGHVENVEAVFDDAVYFRMTMPGLDEPVIGTLKAGTNGVLTSTDGWAWTTCGVKPMTVTATPE